MATATQPEHRSGIVPSPVPNLHSLLEGLYRDQMADQSTVYLDEHAKSACVANQIRTFDWYRPHLPESGTILDWGCNHAPDSCLLRATYGNAYELVGCDFWPETQFPVFHDHARLQYQQLRELVALPYESQSFDVVIGSGVLEHTAFDYESLKELHRVLKPNGLLVISYLPNWLSVAEWWHRVRQRPHFHRRLYTFREASQLLKRAGFYPFEGGYHTYFWERLFSPLVHWVQRPLAQTMKYLLPVQVFSSTFCFLARRMSWM